MAIGTVEFDLSMVDQETGRRLTARAYTVEGITNADGTLRELSIGQLVMALCLDRASKLEVDIIALMEEMNGTSSQLEAMTEIEQTIVDFAASEQSERKYKSLKTLYLTTAPYNGVSYYDFLTDSRYGIGIDFGPNRPEAVWINSEYADVEIKFDDFITQVEAKMDGTVPLTIICTFSTFGRSVSAFTREYAAISVETFPTVVVKPESRFT